jgi:dienelactone hydrolase
MPQKFALIPRSLLALLTFMTLTSAPALAKIKTESIEYKQGDQTLVGYLAYDTALKGARPGVLPVHAWMGLDDYTKRRARELAQLGYVAFAADIYGKGNLPKTADEAAKISGQYRSGDRKLLRERAEAGLAELEKNKSVDKSHLFAIGYCFGGTAVMELAMTGAPLKAMVTFHGGMDFSKTIADVKNIKAHILILHGALDPYSPLDQVMTLEKAMNDAKIDYQIVLYSGAVHAFTDPSAGNDPSRGAAYNPIADHRSFLAMKDFFAELSRPNH